MSRFTGFGAPFPHIYSGISGNQPASILDDNFNQIRDSGDVTIRSAFLTTSYTLLNSDNYSSFYCVPVADMTLTLPAPVAGYSFTFFNESATPGVGTPHNVTIVGTVKIAGVSYLNPVFPGTFGSLTNISGGVVIYDGSSWQLFSTVFQATFPLLASLGGTGSSNFIFNVTEYGADPTGVADSTTAIQNALNDAGNVGSSIVLVPKGIYKISTLTMARHGVRLMGVSSGEVREAVAQVHTSGSVFKWGGAPGGTMLTMAPPSGAGNYRLAGAGIEGIYFDGQNSANIGLDLQSLNECVLRQLAFFGCKDAAIQTKCVDTLATPRDLQHNLFERIWIEAANGGTATSTGIRLDAATNGLSDTSANTFIGLHILYRDGVGIDLKNCDANTFINTHMIRYGSGTGVIFRASPTSDFFTARNNFFFYLEPHTGGVLAESNTYPSTNNVIYGYTQSNGAPTPVIQAGATLWYETEDFSSRIRKQTHTASVRINASQSINDSSDTAVAFNAENFDTSAMHDTVTNNTRVFAPIAGKYLLTIGATWTVNSTGQRTIFAKLNGSSQVENSVDVRAANGGNNQTASVVINLAAIDYVEMLVNQNSGAPLNLTNATLTLTYLGE